MLQCLADKIIAEDDLTRIIFSIKIKSIKRGVLGFWKKRTSDNVSFTRVQV